MNRLRTAVPRPIPERHALPYVGHALGIPRGGKAIGHLLRECEDLGPIFRLRLFDNEQVVVSGSDIVAELSDPSVFSKCVHSDLVRLRDIGGDGLFTAFNTEPNWRKAHNILMPSFTREAMRNYHEKMVTAAHALIGSWERAASRAVEVDVSQDMTRLTFDTIGMCGFGQSFDSFTGDGVHPFVAAMVGALTHAQVLSETPPFLAPLRIRGNRQYAKDLATMQRLITDVIDRRRAHDPTRDDDLLGRMLNTVDPETGELLDDANIRNQVVTFLIAGHETTGAAMSFALHYLSKHPAVLARAQREVDDLWGTEDDPAPSFDDVGRLSYVRQVLDEALRLWPTAPGFAVSPNCDTVVGGYEVREGEVLQVFIPALHRQPEWGANVHGFDPDRFSPDRMAARPGHVYKPFGQGERACIGRQFALHEATLVLAMLIHRFELDDRRNYQLSLSMTLTIKPDAFFLAPRLRTPSDRRPTAVRSAAPAPEPVDAEPLPRRQIGAMSVFHGSNLGTSAAIAREIAATAKDRGLQVSMAPLDDAIERLDDMASDELMVVVASSYNGQPTDDAARFVAWLRNREPGSLQGRSYTVLGIGDRSYADTYQYVPTCVDEALAAAGAARVVPRGAADVGGNFAAAVTEWSNTLWRTVSVDRAARPTEAEEPAKRALVLEPVTPAPELLARHHGLSECEILDAYELVDTDHPLGRSKRFLRLQLPDGMSYRTGDHLAVLPVNPPELVARTSDVLGARPDDLVRIHLTGWWNSALPVDQPVSVRDLLAGYVELQKPATADDVTWLAQNCGCPPERQALEDRATRLRSDAESVPDLCASVVDLLEAYGSVAITLEQFLTAMAPLQPRRYSISSSHHAAPETVDLMVSVVDAPRRGSDPGDTRRYRGVASTYLAGLSPGDTVAARVVPCNGAFRITPDDEAILVSAGTGLAPFRGMIADRRAHGSTARLLAYFGCDHPDVDFLHRAELQQAQDDGYVSLRPTFAFAPVDGHRFVQDRMVSEADELWSLLTAGAQIRVCGDAARLGAGVEAALLQIAQRHAPTGSDAHQYAGQWLDGLRRDRRYVCDVW